MWLNFQPDADKNKNIYFETALNHDDDIYFFTLLIYVQF